MHIHTQNTPHAHAGGPGIMQSADLVLDVCYPKGGVKGHKNRTREMFVVHSWGMQGPQAGLQRLLDARAHDPDAARDGHKPARPAADRRWQRPGAQQPHPLLRVVCNGSPPRVDDQCGHDLKAEAVRKLGHQVAQWPLLDFRQAQSILAAEAHLQCCRQTQTFQNA